MIHLSKYNKLPIFMSGLDICKSDMESFTKDWRMRISFKEKWGLKVFLHSQDYEMQPDFVDQCKDYRFPSLGFKFTILSIFILYVFYFYFFKYFKCI